MSLLDDAGKLNATRYPNLAALAGRWRLVQERDGRQRLHAVGAPFDRDRTISRRAKHPDAARPSEHRVLAGRSQPPPRSVRGRHDRCARASLCDETGHAAVRSRVRDGRRHRRRCGSRVSAAVSACEPAGPHAELGGIRGAADDADEATSRRRAPSEGRTGARVIRATRNWQQRWHGARGTDAVGSAEAFIDGISRDDIQPTLYFIHTLASHRPSRWLPSGQRISESSRYSRADRWEVDRPGVAGGSASPRRHHAGRPRRHARRPVAGAAVFGRVSTMTR